jgi:hypothetical protein
MDEIELEKLNWIIIKVKKKVFPFEYFADNEQIKKSISFNIYIRRGKKNPPN